MFAHSPRSMPLSPGLTDKAQAVAVHLHAHTPVERALIWHQAELLCEAQVCDTQEPTLEPVPRATVQSARSELENQELIAHCMHLARAFPRLSSDARLALLDLAQSMLEDERFERLMADTTTSD